VIELGRRESRRGNRRSGVVDVEHHVRTSEDSARGASGRRTAAGGTRKRAAGNPRSTAPAPE